MRDYTMGKLSCQWTRLKRANVKLAHAMRRAGDKRWCTVLQCAREATVRYCPACGRAHAQGTNCCRHRLCPICQVRRSRKLAHQAIAAAQWLAAEGRLDGVRMGLVTLTQRNVPADLLPGMIDSMLAALTRMRHQRAVRRYMIGSARNIEITYNQQAGTYHPHVHLIVMLAPGAPDEMLTSAYWRDLWGDLMQLDYAPICDARELHDRDKAVCEVSKYLRDCLTIYCRRLSQRLTLRLQDGGWWPIRAYGRRLDVCSSSATMTMPATTTIRIYAAAVLPSPTL